MLKNYVDWKVSNGGGFHPTFEQDRNRIWWLHKYQFIGAGVGVLFAGCVINPNFIRRRSYYAKKFSIGLWGLIGFSLAKKYYDDQMLFTMLKMNDYLPLEIKRALEDKDFRHLALFD